MRKKRSHRRPCQCHKFPKPPQPNKIWDALRNAMLVHRVIHTIWPYVPIACHYLYQSIELIAELFKR